MAYAGILFPEQQEHGLFSEPPDYFKDVSLDRIVEAIVAGRREVDLRPLYYTPLKNVKEIRYRQEIMRDLEDAPVYECVKTFSRGIYLADIGIQSMEKNAAQPGAAPWNYLEKGELLEFACSYCGLIDQLAEGLTGFSLKAQGLLAFREYLLAYQASEGYTVLRTDALTLKQELSDVHYCMLIRDGSVKVRRYEGEEDTTPDIEKLFERFRQGDAEDYTQRVPDEPYSRQVEAEVLQAVSRLYPQLFAKLDQFCVKHRTFLNQVFCDFSYDVQFYISYLEYIAPFRSASLAFCYPVMETERTEISAGGMFDIALAEELLAQGENVVNNDFSLSKEERVIIVTGPNQGGKTTFARVFGQIFHFSLIGCPVAAENARLPVFDRLFTHFEREENLLNLSGKLQDDLVRIREILRHATKDSVILINEILASTTLQDAVFIGKKLMDSILEIGCLCVCVTFLDELASYSDAVVSMVSTVAPDDPTRRTYRIVRGDADGVAYASHIAQKYRLTYSELKERIPS